MLSRKSSCAGTMSASFGVERVRVGERLQAALAGLQELHLLKDRQSDMVSWALGLDRQEPGSYSHAGVMGSEEQRLEETLTSLKQQLSRLRKQDVGLKTHLQQLDQQISELKLDVSKASLEELESDSRPSSGFYELSDGGSCSRSNSCTSVYSECLSSSQTSLIPLSPANCPSIPLPKADVCCWRSADEGAAQANPQWAAGLHLLNSRIRASATGTEQMRPRPVSTGDLDKIMAQGLGYFKSLDAKKPPMSPKQMTSLVDPKFQEFLSGADVYQYPSPLHAVALHGPVFSQGGEVGVSAFLESQGAPLNNYGSLQIGYETKTLDYIDKLIHRSLRKIQRETKIVKHQGSYGRKPIEIIHMSAEVSQKGTSVLPPPQAKTNIKNNYGKYCMAYVNQEPTDKTNQKQSVKVPDVFFRHSYPAAMKECSSDEITHSSLRKNAKPREENVSTAGSHGDKSCGDNQEPRPQERKAYRPAIVHSSSTDEGQGFDIHSSHTGSPEFVHAKFVPAGSQKIKVSQADHKTRAVKLKRKSSEKPRLVKQQHGFPSGERTREMTARANRELRRSEKGKGIEKVNTCQSQEQCTGIDSVPHSPGLMLTHKVHPKAHPNPVTTNFGKHRRLQFLEYEHLTEQRKRRGVETAKWQSDMNAFQPTFVQSQRSKQAGAQPSENIQMVHNISAKPGQWMGPSHPFQPSIFSNSFLYSLNSKYPPAPFHMSTHYPPRCESEYSAECASLFHSTIAESSEGEMSDNTTNRFGDSESSQSVHSFSDSDSRLSLDEGDQADVREEDGGLLWAGQTLKQLPPCREPSACRIKASRALKKKIRRFQPASLKVITLV